MIMNPEGQSLGSRLNKQRFQSRGAISANSLGKPGCFKQRPTTLRFPLARLTRFHGLFRGPTILRLAIDFLHQQAERLAAPDQGKRLPRAVLLRTTVESYRWYNQIQLLPWRQAR